MKNSTFASCRWSVIWSRAIKAASTTPFRFFRTADFAIPYMVKRTGCGIEKPSDLNGKRVALDTLQNSAGLWMRGILQDHYGVDLKTIEWWCQEEEDIRFEPASWMNVKRVAHGKNVDQMLTGRRVGSGALSGNPAFDP